MSGGSIETALNRMEAALARIEAAAARPAASDSDLQARHEQLRGAVAQSLRQLDALLARRQS